MDEGDGAGLEPELFLPLGTDMIDRVKRVQAYLFHGLERFGHITNNVDIDKKYVTYAFIIQLDLPFFNIRQ